MFLESSWICNLKNSVNLPCNGASVGPEQDITLDGNSDNEFADDEVLKMLRQRAQTYREQLRWVIQISVTFYVTIYLPECLLNFHLAG